METYQVTDYDEVKSDVEKLLEAHKYEKAANCVADALGIKLRVLSVGYGKHFSDDKDERYTFKMRLSRGKKSYTFRFGQSIANGSNEPTMYDVLSCLTKYPVGSFDNFCGDFGYDRELKSSFNTYKAVTKEYNAMARLFAEKELELISTIW